MTRSFQDAIHKAILGGHPLCHEIFTCLAAQYPLGTWPALEWYTARLLWEHALDRETQAAS